MPEVVRTVNKDKTMKWQRISFGIIALLTIGVYYPSLWGGPYFDQIDYFAEVAHKHSWWDLAIGSYNFNRVRVLFLHDPVLFRPGFYFFLGNEKYFFGYTFWMWQAVGIICHLGVVWWLLRLLLTIRVSIFASLIAGFFSLKYMNCCMVIFQNISSYMFSAMLVLIALYHAYEYGEKKRYESWRLVVIFVSLLISAFTYEAGGVYLILLAIYLWIRVPKEKRGKGILALLLIPFMYLLASLGDFGAHRLVGHQIDVTQCRQLINNIWSIHTLENMCVAIGWWLYSGLFPVQHQILLVPGMPNVLKPDNISLFKPLNLQDPFIWIGISLVICYILTIFYGFKHKLFQPRWMWWLLLGNILLFYIFIICIGRINLRETWISIKWNSYYSYMFWLWFLLLAYSLVDFKIFYRKLSVIVFKFILMGLIVLFGVYNGVIVHRTNVDRAKIEGPSLSLVHIIETLIKEHGHEIDFSFYVDPNYPGNYCLFHQFSGYMSNEILNKSLIELLYPQYFNTKNPKYIISNLHRT